MSRSHDSSLVNLRLLDSATNRYLADRQFVTRGQEHVSDFGLCWHSDDSQVEFSGDVFEGIHLEQHDAAFLASIEFLGEDRHETTAWVVLIGKDVKVFSELKPS